MKLVFIGDVVGKVGCLYLQKIMPLIYNKYKPDFLVVNGENSANGNGITEKSAAMIFEAGADVITTGNHCFQRRDNLDVFDKKNVLRPANYPEGNVGGGVYEADLGRYSIAVVNIQGTAFLDPLDNPFALIEKILSKIDTKNIFVDFHAESTAEKQAMGYHLNGRVTGVFGTHTHVQTADEAILSKGTAYITDAGMTGPKNSILGTEIKPALDRFIYRYAEKFREAEGACKINGVAVEFDPKTGIAESIERINICEN